MVSKRQKEAQKRFKEANPQQANAPDLVPNGEAGKKSIKKKHQQQQKKKNGLTKKTGGSALRKHPFRVPGMRPGESCFLCKSTDHIAKLCPEKAIWEKNKICLLCRQHGHSLKNCPEKSDTNKKKLCYNCGEAGHSLSKCPLPLEDGGTKFASCFICKEQGHLSKNCPKSTHGVYPKGGSCKICGEVTHLAKYCPNKGKQNLSTSSGQQNLDKSDGRNQKIHFSGDDLEDDFLEESVLGSKKDATSSANSLSGIPMDDSGNNPHAKPKKQGPKIVNFLG
ncbi:hypothetical protein Cni_G19286 [Canna indica]|uniref:CCHC-type domain-containing protein n=1 Tax=Canna indica TaxID=4628 RepID=A0AAQ3QGT2_9LILI|nr:hypothetical protein Cni_G19286 [Canna indica]